ncbi:MAG: MarR family transcriptional regulator [Bacilli bacterium]
MEKDIVLELRTNIHQLTRLFGLNEQTKTPCGFALSISQVIALQELNNQQLSGTNLAEKLRLERSSVSRLIDSLVKGGFVLRKENEHNRRETLLSLTEKGERTVTEVSESSVQFFRTILINMTEQEQKQLIYSLRKFTSSLLKVMGESK